MLWNQLKTYRDTGLLLLRLAAGLYMILGHGWGKITAGPERWADLGGAMDLLGIGFVPIFWGFMSAITESLGALLVAVGLGTRTAALFLVANMTVAANMHIQTGNGSPETAILYGVAFLTIFLTGPGSLSLDAQLQSS